MNGLITHTHTSIQIRSHNQRYTNQRMLRDTKKTFKMTLKRACMDFIFCRQNGTGKNENSYQLNHHKRRQLNE